MGKASIRLFSVIEPLEARRLFAAGNSLTGIVFDDKNGNGVREAGENALANQVVYLDANRNGLLDTGETQTLTNASGTYTFSNLAIGNYRIRQAPGAGRRLTFPHAIFYDVSVPPSIATKSADFGNSTMGVVKGTIFEDLNGDGHKQSNEKGLPGWRVFLDKDGDGVYDPGKEKTRLTNSRGEYRFADLPPGLYYLKIEQQSGFRRINPLNGMFKFTITSGISFSNRNFAEKLEKDSGGTDT